MTLQHLALHTQLFDLRDQVVVSLLETEGRTGYITKDWAGRILFQCLVQGERVGDFAARMTVPTPIGEVSIARSWGWVDAEVAGDPVRFVNTHTEAYDERVRDAQRDQLLHAVGDIALLVGYENFAAFTTAFTRHFGAPPSSFRRRSRARPSTAHNEG